VPLILGVDTSCDDTGVGLVDLATGRVAANVVASQDRVHAAFGGVVPERASREHLAVVDDVLHRALRRADARLSDVAAVGATYGPGLVGALLVGLAWGKALAWARDLAFVPVHHLEGHLASAGDEAEGPMLCLIASGGHTSLFRVDADGRPRELGRSRDDAAGEAFDKVARLLGLGFPGGPALARLAEGGDPDAVQLPLPLRGQAGYDFSFSGLKTAVAVRLERDPDVDRADLAAAFEATVVASLVGTLERAARATGLRTVVVAGGVAANRRLRDALEASGLTVRVPPAELATDNGAMIALAARRRLRAGPVRSDWTRDAAPYLPLDPAERALS
jgi:N6-L-threonylcarbamoyladenine synthase